MGRNIGPCLKPFGNGLRQHVEQEPFGYFLFRRDSIIKFLRFQMQQADFEHVVNPHQDLREIERFADEILRPGLQGAQLLIRLGGNHEDRQVAVDFHFLQLFHDLESIHAWHLQIEEDQGVAVAAVKLANLMRILGRCYRRIAGATQHALE